MSAAYLKCQLTAQSVCQSHHHWRINNGYDLAEEEISTRLRARCDVMQTGQTGNRDNPSDVQGAIACTIEWDLVRGLHQGQQSQPTASTGPDRRLPHQCHCVNLPLQRGAIHRGHRQTARWSGSVP